MATNANVARCESTYALCVARMRGDTGIDIVTFFLLTRAHQKILAHQLTGLSLCTYIVDGQHGFVGPFSYTSTALGDCLVSLLEGKFPVISDSVSHPVPQCQHGVGIGGLINVWSAGKMQRQYLIMRTRNSDKKPFGNIDEELPSLRTYNRSDDSVQAL